MTFCNFSEVEFSAQTLDFRDFVSNFTLDFRDLRSDLTLDFRDLH